jgi:hypothetical protein
MSGTTTSPLQVFLGVLDGSTVKGRAAPAGGNSNSGTVAASDHQVVESLFVVSGLTASTAYTWDAAYAVETSQTSSNLQYGGPNDTTTNNAWGGFAYEIWKA